MTALHQSVCECGEPTCPADDGRFYVSAIDNGQYRLLLGPFATHETALNLVDVGRRLVEQIDPYRSHWYAYGTCRSESTIRPVFVACDRCGEIHYYRLTHVCGTPIRYQS